MLSFLDQAAIMQQLRRDLFVRVEMLIESGETDLDPLLLEDIRETALGQAPVQRHLAAFETDLARITRTRLLSLLTTARRMPQTGAWPTADALLLVGRTLRRL